MSEQNPHRFNLEYDFFSQQFERNIKRRRVAKKLARMRYKPIYRREWSYKLRNRFVFNKVVDHYFFLESQNEQEVEASEGLEEWYKKYKSTL